MVDVMEARTHKAELKSGKMTVGAAVELYKRDLNARVKIKESTKKFWLQSLKSVISTWPDFLSLDIRKITEKDCQEWAAESAKNFSPS